jgi:energy-coupling factor transport system ATP-binding protein
MIELKHINYKYPSGGNENSLSDFNLHINAGEFIVLCGKSGCGKTTVTRLLNGLIPHFYEGTLAGEITINGYDVIKSELSQMARMVGSVFQNPKSQFFNVDTDGEMAFGCENMALPRAEIISNVERATCDLDLKELLGRNIFQLSGGEKQQIACGSVYATNPLIYVLDEPSSNMDVRAIERFQKTLEALKKGEKTIVISEHRLYYLMKLADRFIYMQDGKAVQSFLPDEINGMSNRELADLGLRVPNQNRVSYTGNKKSMSFGETEGFTPVLQIDRLSCRRGGHEVISIPELKIPAHSVIAVIGENGAGKSTLIEALCGFLKHKGSVWTKQSRVKRSKRTQCCYMVMQDVNRQLFCSSVIEEVLLGLPVERENLSNNLLEDMELAKYKDRHPASLSGGQKQRVAICAAIGAGKEFVFYDEPTSGLDFDGMNRLCDLIRQNADFTLSTLVITHDFELVMGCCTHVLHLDKGRVVDFYPFDAIGINKARSYFVRAESGY